jgi:yersiniabactin nonribosomal peptide synthetase
MNQSLESKAIAVVMEKGWEQVVATLAILQIGAADLPIDAKSWSEHRIRQVLEISGAVGIISQSDLIERESDKFGWLRSLNIPVIEINEKDIMKASLLTRDEEQLIGSQLEEYQPQDSQQLAYLIYTSGSTGIPKGVCCHHVGAMNTIQDLNDAFHVTKEDRVLGLSSLSFDLSVYDIFGMLHAGGTLILPPSSSISPPDPGEWYEIMDLEKVSIWNTVPAFMEIMVSYCEMEKKQLPASLRLVFLSGDWIPLSLPNRIRGVSKRPENLQIVSMGGATEASIWSNIYELRWDGEGVSSNGIPEGWKSIPYGRPMRNQQMYILNDRLEHCEPWVTGVIYIGGIGVAHGYYRNDERTNYQFITHPRTGEKLFRTGDLGRLRPEGLLEILGREDLQVKLNGYRIELGEIESIIEKHEKVLTAIVAVKSNSLCGYIKLREGKRDGGGMNVEEADKEVFEELKELCKSSLTEYMVPQHWMMIEEIPLNGNGKVARDSLPDIVVSTVIGTDNNRLAFGSLESSKYYFLREVWSTVLGVSLDTIMTSSNFFSLGGDSLKSMQLVSRLKANGLKISISLVFAHPTIGEMTELCQELESFGPEVLGTSSEAVDAYTIFAIEDPSTPLHEYPLIGINKAHFVGLHTSSYSTSEMSPQIYFQWKFDGISFASTNPDKQGQLDLLQFENAINHFIRRHRTFQSIITEHGSMQILPQLPIFKLSQVHIWDGNYETALQQSELFRLDMMTNGPSGSPFHWPLFDIRVTQISEHESFIHIVVSLFLMDAMSDLILRQELSALYRQEVFGMSVILPSLSQVEFSQYSYAMEHKLKLSEEYIRAEKYWEDRSTLIVTKWSRATSII